MSNLNETATWEPGIYQLEKEDLVQGGPDGIDNVQAKQLGNRTLYLKDMIELTIDEMANHLADADPHQKYALETNIQKSTHISSSAGGTSDAITGVYVPSIIALANGMTLYVRAASKNATTAPTFTPSVGTIPAKAIVKGAGTSLVAGDIAGAGHWLELKYDNAIDKWVLQNPATGIVAAQSQQPGEVCYFARSTAPTGFLKANGAAISRTTYSALFAAIGVTFGAGDGATTFNIPDLRGEFIRGVDDSRGVDRGRIFGEIQSDLLKSHTHSLPIVGYGSRKFDNSTGTGYGSESVVTYPSTDATGGEETRPRNVALLACIKY